MRNPIHNFNENGLDALKQGSSRPTEVHAAFDEHSARALQEMLHQDPRKFGKDAGKRRDHPSHPGAPWGALAEGETLDRKCGSRVREKKGIEIG